MPSLKSWSVISQLGVVDEDVHHAELADGALEEAVDLRGVGDVGRHRQGAAAHVRD